MGKPLQFQQQHLEPQGYQAASAAAAAEAATSAAAASAVAAAAAEAAAASTAAAGLAVWVRRSSGRRKAFSFRAHTPTVTFQRNPRALLLTVSLMNAIVK
ncbi:hypothetical protein Emed_001577 [Eimeria media]